MMPIVRNKNGYYMNIPTTPSLPGSIFAPPAPPEASVTRGTATTADDAPLDWNRLDSVLTSFATLLRGWNGYKAPAPSDIALANAREFLTYLRYHRELPTRLAPSVVGEVGFTFRKGEKKLYVEMGNKGDVCALFSDGKTEPLAEMVTPNNTGFSKLHTSLKAYLNG